LCWWEIKMTKFNLKTYQKISGDEHIERRLKEQHGKEPNEINEAQLENSRVDATPQLIEKRLEKIRSGEADQVTEKRLDDVKAAFDIKNRNPSAYEGAMNKLEEKRLSADPVEDEKYEDASVTPKQFRWWETKTDDGFKLAQKKNVTKIAQAVNYDDSELDRPEELSFEDSKRWNRLPSSEEGIDQEFKIKDEFPSVPLSLEVPIDFVPMDIVKQKDLTGLMSGVYMVLEFNADSYRGNVARIEEDALKTIIEARPALSGLITVDDLYGLRIKEDSGIISLRATGDELAAAIGGGKTPLEEITAAVFDEMSYKEENQGGTMIATGKIRVNAETTPDNQSDIVSAVLDFIKGEHPALVIKEESLDVSDLNNGEVSYVVGVPNAMTEAEFKITDITTSSEDVKKK